MHRRERPSRVQRTPELRAEAQKIEAQIELIRRKLRSRLEAEFGRGGLTAPQRMVMQELVGSEGLSLKALSARVSLAHSTVSGIVERLQKQGLVLRKTLQTDRRVTHIAASAEVRKFLQKRMPELAITPLLRALQHTTEKQRRVIREGLNTLETLLGEE
jgi:DNA-binding MarR family transcriptional regulator